MMTLEANLNLGMEMLNREIPNKKKYVRPNENPKCWTVDHVVSRRRETKEEWCISWVLRPEEPILTLIQFIATENASKTLFGKDV